MSNQPDSGPASGAGSQSSGQPSGGGDAQPNSVDVDALVDRLLEHPKFSDALGRKVQSQKDRRINKLQQGQGEIRESLDRVLELMDGGMSQDDAMFRWEVEQEILARRSSQEGAPSEPESPPDKQPKAPSEETEQLLKVLGIAPNDPDVIKILMKGEYTSQDFINLAIDRGSETPAPAPAGIVPSGGGGQSNPSDLQAQYNADLEKVRRGDVDAIANLKEKYRKLGLQVW